MTPFPILVRRFWSGIAILLLLSQAPTLGAENTGVQILEKRKAEKARREAEEQEIKALFGFSVADIQDRLVIVSCQGSTGSSEGTGFIAQMNGFPYLFTSKGYLLGADKITFKTVGGKLLRPRGIEFSTTRNIARFPLEGEEGLSIGTQKSIGMPVAVFGNSQGSGVITELYGKVSEVGSDKFEVSANFVAGNNGSPVLGTNMQVVGMASHVALVRQKKADNDDADESYKTRHFCIPLSGNRWTAIDWKQYNRKYGKPYRKNEQIFDPVLSAVQQWIGNPLGPIAIEPCSDSDVKEWLEFHNAMATTIARSIQLIESSKENHSGVSHIWILSVIKSIAILPESAEMLAGICKKYERKLSVFSNANSRDPTGFISGEYRRSTDFLKQAETAIPIIAASLLEELFNPRKD